MKNKLLLILFFVLISGTCQTLNATNIVVTNLNDSGTGSLRWAIGAAASGDTITFAVTGTILFNSVIDWSKNLTIIGPASPGIVLDGQNSTSMFQMSAGNNIVRNLSFKHGVGGSIGGGCIYSPMGNTTDTTIIEHCSFKNSSAIQGGAVACSNARYLIMRYCSVDSCTSTNSGGGIAAIFGAILENSTISNCHASGNGGAAWIAINETKIINCTFVNNSAQQGGAIFFQDQCNNTLINNTFFGNTASVSGDAIFGMTMSYAPSFIFQNNIFNSPSNNFGESSSYVTCSSNGGNISNDLSMSAFLNASHDVNNTDPLLSPSGLQNNGGTTMTVALTATSPAVDNGILYNSPLLDQRDYSRNGSTDAGAFEYNGFAPCTTAYSSITVSNCGEYLSPSGNYTWITSGNYQDTLHLPGVCDSVITIHLTVVTIDVSVSQNGPQLTAVETGASYLWLDCNAGFSPISVGQTFTATANGSYAVRIDKSGCVDTSTCHAVTNIGILENDFGASLSASPNPTSNNVNISLGKEYLDVKVKVINAAGQIILTDEFHSAQQFTLELTGPTGYYFIEIVTDTKEKALIKILKN